MDLLYPLAKRFIAGRHFEEALPALKQLHAEGFQTTVDFLGESVRDPKMADEVVGEYCQVLQRLADEGLPRNVSLKLTQLGLDIDGQLCFDNVARILITAGKLDAFVRVDMEGSAYTQKTLDMVIRWHRIYPCLGAVIQSMLKRSASDVDRLLHELVPIRLVKGAYKEPAAHAYQDKREVEDKFKNLAGELIHSGLYHGIATHDEAIISGIQMMCERENIRKDSFEFQLLYGVRRTLQKKLLKEGFHVRIYVPYGKSWLPYVSRRIRERKENFWFVMKNIFRS